MTDQENTNSSQQAASFMLVAFDQELHEVPHRHITAACAGPSMGLSSLPSGVQLQYGTVQFCSAPSGHYDKPLILAM